MSSTLPAIDLMIFARHTKFELQLPNMEHDGVVFTANALNIEASVPGCHDKFSTT